MGPGGYHHHETDYGPGISIEQPDVLDRAIADNIIFSPARIGGQEVRFLRSMTHKSQTEIARELGIRRITVARWEAAPNTPIPGPADRALRLFTAKNLFEYHGLNILVDLFSEITDERPERLEMTYLPEQEPEAELPIFNDEKPGDEPWRPAKVRVA